MKKFYLVFTAIIAVTVLLGGYLSSIKSQTAQTSDTFSALLTEKERRDLSHSLANLLWANLNNYAPYYDFDVMLEELQALSDKKTPPLAAREYHQTLLDALGKIELYQAAADLKETERLLNSFHGKPEMNELIAGKLYYELIKPGVGAIVTSHSSPTLIYSESYLDDGVVRSRRSPDQPIKLSLGDTLKGFSMGVEGMRVGEKRKIYVHPELAYGKLIGNSPQEFVIFEVEVIAL